MKQHQININMCDEKYSEWEKYCSPDEQWDDQNSMKSHIIYDIKIQTLKEQVIFNMHKKNWFFFFLKKNL